MRIEEQPVYGPPQTDPQWWLNLITIGNLFILVYLARAVYIPLYLMVGWGIVPK